MTTNIMLRHMFGLFFFTFQGKNMLELMAGVFKNTDGENFSRVQTLSAVAGRNAGVFGQRVRISQDGEFVYVGAPRTGSGEVTIFKKQADGYGDPQVVTQSVTGTVNDRFGYQIVVSADNSTMVVTVQYAENYMGVAEVFDLNSDGIYEFKQRLYRPGGKLSDYFSISGISGDGNTIVGCVAGSTSVAGQVHVFKRNAEGLFENAQTLTSANGPKGTNFGANASISEDASVIGVYLSQYNNSDGGFIVFTKQADGRYVETQFIHRDVKWTSAAYGSNAKFYDNGNILSFICAEAPSRIFIFDKIDGQYVERGFAQAPEDGVQKGFFTDYVFFDDMKGLLASSTGGYSDKGCVIHYKLIDGVYEVFEKITLETAVKSTYYGQTIDITRDGGTFIVGEYAGNANLGCAHVYKL